MSDEKATASTRGPISHDGNLCYYKGLPYSPGATECMNGKLYKCTDNGTWDETQYGCKAGGGSINDKV